MPSKFAVWFLLIIITKLVHRTFQNEKQVYLKIRQMLLAGKL